MGIQTRPGQSELRPATWPAGHVADHRLGRPGVRLLADNGFARGRGIPLRGQSENAGPGARAKRYARRRDPPTVGRTRGDDASGRVRMADDYLRLQRDRRCRRGVGVRAARFQRPGLVRWRLAAVDSQDRQNPMNQHQQPRTIPRREALRRVSAGTMLALGLWPGALRADNDTPAGSFRFLVINDTHCLTPECGHYLEGVVAQMKDAQAELCLHAGDVTDKADGEYFEAVKDIFCRLPGSMYPVIGNHDYRTQTDRQAYTQAFPAHLNYYFDHRGWQFIGLDTCEGQHYEKTKIQPATFQWLDDYLPRLDKKKPTVVLTHFPLGAGVTY